MAKFLPCKLPCICLVCSFFCIKLAYLIVLNTNAYLISLFDDLIDINLDSWLSSTSIFLSVDLTFKLELSQYLVLFMNENEAHEQIS